MKVKQISLFLENKKGRLLEVLNTLGKEKINIRALSIADTSDFGILRLIVPDPDKAKAVLGKNNFTVKETDVIAVGVPDSPGGLALIIGALDKSGINVEYIYAFAEKKEKEAIVVIRTENIDEGIKVLKAAGIRILPAKEVYSL
ncbi:MAG: hypothetical protein A2297_09010 [Elusimicrobia bacterium RIFOXYB2_FULL_48_7]|nr:MAG: hypothetical protein A2297_09010 [Elusimicrobia bacterium RIFOXYB2_FULL_48_7]